jgi:hypothetical protein
MTYRGIVSKGVVVLEGDKPDDGTVVEVTPVGESPADLQVLANHPAIAMWKD